MSLGLVLLLRIGTLSFFLAQQINASMFDVNHEKIQDHVTSESSGMVAVSTPEECARSCADDEPPKICYYHFTLENYNVNGAACQFCIRNSSGDPDDHCQCVLADGVERGVLTANRMIPGPSIEVCEGDKVVVDVENHMSGLEVAIHWHGVFQNGFQYYDGVPRVTQCPITQGTTFRYQFTAANAGTHFWHSHDGLQEIDGLYGSLVVREPPSKDPNSNLYDHDLSSHVVLISDWMHVDGEEKFPGFRRTDVGQKPVSVLINGRGRYEDPNTGNETNVPRAVFTISSGRRYRFRLINAFVTVCPAQISFEGHRMTVIAADGEPVVPVSVNTIVSFSGERYDFVITADQPDGAYWIQLRGLGECAGDRVQTLGILRYKNASNEPSSPAPTYVDGLVLGIVLNPIDGICNEPRSDAVCVNQLKNARVIDERILQERADIKVFLPYRFFIYDLEELFQSNTYKMYLVNSYHLTALVNEISFQFPPVPPLTQADDIDPEQFCDADKKPADCGEDCRCMHTIDVPLGAVVEVVLVDEVQQPNLSHPFHLHGHAFNVIGMGRIPGVNLTSTSMSLKRAIDMDRKGLLNRTFDLPPGKDTIAVPYNGYVILRFISNNPGYWLFHCHFLYHMVIGMNLLFHVGTHDDLPPIPPNFPVCGNHLPPINPPAGNFGHTV